MAGPGYAPIPQVANYAQQNYGPPQGYGAPAPNPYQQYPPPIQPPPPVAQLSLSELIAGEKGKLSELKRIERSRRRIEQNLVQDHSQHGQQQRQQHGQSRQQQPFDDGGMLITGNGGDTAASSLEEHLADQYGDLDVDELKRILHPMRRGTQEYKIISQMIDDIELAEEQLEADELGEELNQIEFFAVKVWDSNEDNWLPAEARASFDDTGSLVASIKKRFPFATKVKWGVVKKDGREIPTLSSKVYNLQSVKDAELAFEKARKEVRDPSNAGQIMQQPHHQQSLADLAPLLEAMNRDRAETQRMFFDLMKTLKDEKKPDIDPLDNMIKMKELFVTPMLESIKAMNGKGSNIDPFAMVNTMLGGAKQLASMGGGGGGGGDGGLVSTLMQYVGPFIQQLQQGMAQGQPQQQRQQPQQLPPNGAQAGQQNLPAPVNQPRGQTRVEADAANLLRKRCSKIVDNLISGKLTVEQVPRYIYRNGSQPEGEMLMAMNHQQFVALLKSAINMRDPMLRKFIENPKTQSGVQWIFEEFHRLATVISICIRNGDDEQREQIADYSAGVLIETTLVGEQAMAEFISRYGITQEDLTGVPADGGEDLPGSEPELDDDLDEEEDAEDYPETRPAIQIKKAEPSGGKNTSANLPQRAVKSPSPTRPESRVVPESAPRKKKARPSFLKR